MNKMNGMMERLRMMAGMDADDDLPEEEPLLPTDLSQGCNLSRTQRIYGFIACLSLGLFCSILSSVVFLHPLKFAITYSLGNLLSLGSTAFLIGPQQQLNNMFDPVRLGCTLTYLVSMFFALFCSLHLHSRLLTLLAIGVEGCSLVWYTLSYIPFARAAVWQWIQSCLAIEF
ncbi:hypothetical protein O6H91_13G064600 [Diphasiastrum complanatum]|uniref:Uncharacterized protein n=1 Tax=Diphasiastrum complanatum TaxID=34168 RepID=A0ACC2BVX5_DIPCM|nr:hypothetical protein O6H91_13G064600 [Diphasiastrum complanatum]